MLRRDSYETDSSASRSSYSVSNVEDQRDLEEDINTRLQHHTKLNIKRQLMELGYTSDVPDDVLEEFIESMQQQSQSHQAQSERYESSSRHYEESERDESMKRGATGVTSATGRETSRVMQRLKKIDLNPMRTSIKEHAEQPNLYPTHSSYQHDHPPPTHSRALSASSTSTTHQPEHHTTFRDTRDRRQIPLKPKKHDPVNRIAEMKRIWANDAFLRRAGDLNVNAGKAAVQAKMSLGPASVKIVKKTSNKL